MNNNEKINWQELAMPKKPSVLVRHFKILTGVIIAALLAYAAGLAAGKARELVRFDQTKKMKDYIYATDYAQLTPLQFKTMNSELQELSITAYAGKVLLAEFYIRASEVMPEREKFLRAAQFELQRLLESSEDNSPVIRHMLANVECDLGNSEKALALLKKIKINMNDPEYIKAAYYNSLAYILASASSLKYKDGQRALELMRTEVMNDQENWRVASYLDTLAESYFAVNDYMKAVQIQKRALALADGTNLWIYLQHYKKYLEAAQ